MPTSVVHQSTQVPSDLHHKETAIRRVFEQVQTSTANHGKNYVALYKTHIEFSAYTELVNKGRGIKLIGERKFERIFHELLLHSLRFKRGVVAADRVVKFVAGYTRFLNEKVLESTDDFDEEGGTIASRFTEGLLQFILPGFLSKDKNARYRVSQLTAEMVSYMGPIDEDLFGELRAALIDRLNDRENAIRSQAVTALARLSALEDTAELEGERSILETLLDSMAFDGSADVRRTAVLTIPMDTQTLPGILDRTRDVDATVRKTVYSRKLAIQMKPAVDTESTEESDVANPAHPLELTLSQRERIVRTGLKDRDSAVKSAAAALIASWQEVLQVKDQENSVKAEENLGENPETPLLAFLDLFDLVEGSIAKEAVLSVFDTKPGILDDIGFNETYWTALTPQKTFLARVFVEYCKKAKDELRLEASMPVVTRIAFLIQEAYNALDDMSSAPINDALDGGASKPKDDEKTRTEIVLSELLKLALYLDYSDEIGRRKTLDLIRHMLKSEALPERLLVPCLDVLRTLAANEADLIRLVVEAIQDLRDAALDEEAPEIPLEDPNLETILVEPRQITEPRVRDMSPGQKLRVREVDLRCLQMCIGTLERVNGTLERNITLDGLLKNLIFPYVQSEESICKEKGIRALGLYCLISKPLAQESFAFFISKVASSPPNIKVAYLESAFDIFMVHEAAIFKDNGSTLEAVTNFLITNILEESDSSVKAVLCEGTAKLMYSGLIKSSKVLQTLIKAFFSPLTADNPRLRQCLAIFFPIYSHSTSENQKRMADAFIYVFLDLCEDKKNAGDAEGDEGPGSSSYVDMFAEWTDPLRLLAVVSDEKAVDFGIQLEMAEIVLKVLFEKDLKVSIERDDKRALCRLLNKLHVPDVVDDYRIRSLKLLMDTLKLRRPLRDSVCRTAFTKFESTISEKFKDQLEGFSEADYRKLEELNELFAFLDSVIPLDDEVLDIDVPRKGKKRRSGSVVTTTSESRSCSPLPGRNKGLRQSKRARLSTSDQDFEDGEDEDVKPAIARRRTQPKRAATAQKPAQVIEISSDSDEDPVQFQKPLKRVSAQLGSSDEEAELDKQLDKLLISKASSSSRSEIPFDSIMDTDSEEAEEVNDLLAAD